MKIPQIPSSSSATQRNAKALDVIDLRPERELLNQLQSMATNSAGTRQLTALSRSANQRPPPLQFKLESLSEERLQHLAKKREERGEDQDTEYLLGLKETSEDRDAKENNPDLYTPVMELPQQALDEKEIADIPGKLMMVYVKIRDINKKESVEMDDVQDVQLYLESGAPTSTGKKVFAFMKTHPSLSGDLEKARNNLVGNILTGGLPPEPSAGYGAIEFRFAMAEGDFYVTRGTNASKIAAVKAGHPNVQVTEHPADDIKRFQSYYRLAQLPYAKERIGTDWVFVEASVEDRFNSSVIDVARTNQSQSLTLSNNSHEGMPPKPSGTQKKMEKTYDKGTTRASRGMGQKAAMSGVSARNYVAHFNEGAANSGSWEWLHLQASSLGGPNHPINLIAGTAEANTQMIPYERIIYFLSKIATRTNPLSVQWTGEVLTTPDNKTTHVGKSITIEADFLNGRPAASDTIDPNLISHFPATINVVESALFSKLDRDHVKPAA